jgi:hypothetical protein
MHRAAGSARRRRDCGRVDGVDAEDGVAAGDRDELVDRRVRRYREVLAAARGDAHARVQHRRALSGRQFDEAHMPAPSLITASPSAALTFFTHADSGPSIDTRYS